MTYIPLLNGGKELMVELLLPEMENKGQAVYLVDWFKKVDDRVNPGEVLEVIEPA